MFRGVCISNVTSVRDVYLSSFKLFCIFWCLLCKTLDYMKLFKNQIQVYQNTKKLRPQVCQMRRRRSAHVG